MQVPAHTFELCALAVLVVGWAALRLKRAGPRRKLLLAQLPFKLGLGLFSLALASVLAEVFLRLFCDLSFPEFSNEKSLMYRYDRQLGWFPVENRISRFTACRTVSITNNSQGFRGPEYVGNDKPGIAFLGDSFVWGYDVEASERFTERLQAKHPAWNVYNLGVSGYGTDQEFLLLQRYFDRFRPRAVFLVFCTDNDEEDNSRNLRHGDYFKPYCTIERGRLRLNGVPVPKSERVFCAEHDLLCRSYLLRLLVRTWYNLSSPPTLRNPNPTLAIIKQMQKYVADKGARFAIGLQTRHPPLEQFLHDNKIAFLDLSTSCRYPAYGYHWTPEGHTFVADAIDAFLAQEKFLD